MPAAGTFTISDFSVTSSATGGTIGSLSGGDYVTGIFVTDEPFSFVWDGTQVTQWLHSGANAFDWHVYDDVAHSGEFYYFGWDNGNVNDPTSGAHRDFNNLTTLAQGTINVAPAQLAAVPEPSSLAIFGMGAGIIGLVTARRRRRAQRQQAKEVTG